MRKLDELKARIKHKELDWTKQIAEVKEKYKERYKVVEAKVRDEIDTKVSKIQ